MQNESRYSSIFSQKWWEYQITSESPMVIIIKIKRVKFFIVVRSMEYVARLHMPYRNLFHTQRPQCPSCVWTSLWYRRPTTYAVLHFTLIQLMRRCLHQAFEAIQTTEKKRLGRIKKKRAFIGETAYGSSILSQCTLHGIKLTTLIATDGGLSLST